MKARWLDYAIIIRLFDPLNELATLSLQSNTTRLQTIILAFNVGIGHPIIGVGIGGFPFQAFEYFLAEIGWPINPNLNKLTATTIYVRIFAELGVI